MNRFPIAAPSILVVDDTPANLTLLVRILAEQGYNVRPVTSGAHALRAVRSNPPDLILLDITMPEMDGYETCRRIRDDPRGAEIPVLFISALSETDDKVKAFEAGGLDYVSKPFQHAEVLARVRTHLELRQRKVVLEKALQRLSELEEYRDKLIHMIVHDMRSPLQAIRLSLELMGESLPESDADCLVMAKANTDTLVDMVSEMLDISRAESKCLEPHCELLQLRRLAHRVIAQLKPLTGETISTQLEDGEELAVQADPELIRRVLSNLLGNAYKFVPKQGSVRIRIQKRDSKALVEVEDNGCGIPPEFHQRIFEKFGQVEGSKKHLGSGIGLTFAKLVVEAHGGEIGVRSAPGQGSTFWFSLPLMREAV